MNETVPTYRVGQSIRVVPGSRNNTPRRGVIRAVQWHHQNKHWCYWIRACDRKVSKRYEDTDLEPVAIDPSWLTEAVVGLANGIYSDRAFERMPILADALQDAGCTSDDILNHCREAGNHVRGCWVVDLLLGKE